MTDFNNYKVCAIQLASGLNVSANLLETERLVGEAAEAGANCVVLPENFAFMGKNERELCSLRENDGDGPLQTFLSQIALRYGIWLVGGTIPLTANDASKVRAASLVFNAKGERVARYDKIHLFNVHLVETHEHYNESETIEPGNEVVVINTPFGRLGIAVCYDLRFPEVFRKMLDKGVQIIALPSAFTAFTGKAHWEILIRARAIENLVYVVAAGQGGYHVNGRETYGHSMVVDPWGSVLARLSRGSGFVEAVIDRQHLINIRTAFPAIDHRRLKCK